MGEKWVSASFTGCPTEQVLLNNINTLAITRDFKGNPRLFIFCGYVCYNIKSNKLKKYYLYIQALCYPIPITSGNSYFPTTKYFFIKQSDLTNNQELIPLSSFHLKTQVIKVYKLF